MGGITRVHGGLVQPKNFAGVSLVDFTLTFWNGDCYALIANGEGTQPSSAAGALDQIFRTATGNVGTVSRVGYLTTGTSVSANYIRFAVEMLGVESADGQGYLGTGPDDAGQGDAYPTPAQALAAAVQALGTVNGINLSSATVAVFNY